MIDVKAFCMKISFKTQFKFLISPILATSCNQRQPKTRTNLRWTYKDSQNAYRESNVEQWISTVEHFPTESWKVAKTSKHNKCRRRSFNSSESAAVGDLDEKSLATWLGDGFAAAFARQYNAAFVFRFNHSIFVNDVTW